MADYAVESGGGRVVLSATSRTYQQTSLQALLGVFPGNAPRTILHPDVSTGQCWAFAGPQGFVTVALPEPVRVSAVTVDHIAYALRRRNSAPRDFAVYVRFCFGGFISFLVQERQRTGI